MSDDNTIENRVRKAELMLSELTTSMIDLKQNVSDHSNKCPFNSYKNDIEEHVTEVKKDILKNIDDKDNTIKWVLGILFTVLIIMCGTIGSIQMSKVSLDTYEKNVESSKQDQIRRDERIQILYENQNQMQKDLLSEISDLKIAIAGLTKTLERH